MNFSKLRKSLRVHVSTTADFAYWGSHVPTTTYCRRILRRSEVQKEMYLFPDKEQTDEFTISDDIEYLLNH